MNAERTSGSEYLEAGRNDLAGGYHQGLWPAYLPSPLGWHKWVYENGKVVLIF